MRTLILSLCIYLFTSISAHAHMMLSYTHETVYQKPTDIEIKLVLTHPITAGTVLDLKKINQFYALHGCLDADVKKIDFSNMLKEITWKNPNNNNGKAFSAKISKQDLQEYGDYVFCIIPDSYYDKDADAYLQQITKLIINIGTVHGNFHAPCNLPCEIIPLCKPYALWVGNIFTGRVLSNGKPVANAEIEVTYLNHQINMSKNTMLRKNRINYPNDCLQIQTIYTDAQGYFSYGLPKSGWWGFTALNVGPETKYEGKDLSQDAVIWVQVNDIY